MCSVRERSEKKIIISVEEDSCCGIVEKRKSEGEGEDEYSSFFCILKNKSKRRSIFKDVYWDIDFEFDLLKCEEFLILVISGR